MYTAGPYSAWRPTDAPKTRRCREENHRFRPYVYDDNAAPFRREAKACKQECIRNIETFYDVQKLSLKRELKK